MKERISALMDGELYEEEANALIGRLRNNSEAQLDWQAYHLIGDALRQPNHLSRDMGASMRERLRDEPVVLAPRRLLGRKSRYIALSAAASLAAVGLVVWMVKQIQTEPAGMQMARQQAPAGNAVVAGKPDAITSKAISKDMDDYLLAHQSSSPGTEIAGGTSYIHTVAAR